MRFSFVLLLFVLLSACGKTGALYLPEEPQQAEQAETQAQEQDSASSGKAD